MPYNYNNKTYYINSSDAEMSHIGNIQKLFRTGIKTSDMDSAFWSKMDEYRKKGLTTEQDFISAYLDEQQNTDNPLVGKVNELQDKLTKRADELSNPNSQFYRDYRRGLTSTLAGSSGTNSLLGLVMAQGGSFAQAAERIKAMRAQTEDKAIQGTENFYQNMQGQANNLYATNLGANIDMTKYYGNQALSYAQLAEQRRQFDESQPSFFDNLLSIGSTAAGYAGGNLLTKWLGK